MLGKALLALLFCLFFIEATRAFTVKGNQIYDANGNVFIVRGVDRCSFEWNVAGQYISLADFTLMKTLWNANTVRLSLNQCFWLSGLAGYSSAYVGNIEQAVTWITGLGMAVILDLHWSNQGNAGTTCAQQAMADSYSLTFWTSVAGNANFKNNPLVFFEMYNEPYVTDWGVWLNGGASGSGFNSVGMQQIYNTIRATGANNVVIAGGVGYAFDLSGVATHAISGTNIAYSTHPYDYSGKQQAQWPAAFGYLVPTYPVIATEFGQYCYSDSYIQELLAYMQGLQMGWTAWAWWVEDCEFPSLISDWNGDALEPGNLVQAQLKAGSSGSAAATTTATTSTSAKSTSTSTSTSAKASTSTSTSTSAKVSTSTSTSSTTAKASTTTGSSSTTGSGTVGTISVVTNSGDDTNWIGINSITGAIYTAQGSGQTVYLKDSSTDSNNQWVAATVQSWGWTWASNTNYIPPFSLKLTATSGKSAILTNLIPGFTGATYSGSTSYQ